MFLRSILGLTVPVIVVGAVAACSSSSPGSKTAVAANGGSVRTINISMADNTYRPNTPITVARGSSVHFAFHNTGKVAHEAIVGDDAAQATHDMEMARSGGMGGMHTGGDEVNVDPGKTASLRYTFTQAGTFIIGCHYPGHYAAGMKIPVTVS